MTAALLAGALVGSAAAALRLLLAAAGRTRAQRRCEALTAARRGPSGWGCPRWVRRRADDADLAPADAERLWRAWVAVVCLGPAVALAAGTPALAVLAVVGAVTGPLVVWPLARRRAEAREETQLPGVLESVARALRSGASLTQAVAESASAATGRLADDLARVIAATSRGAGLTDALEAWGERRPSRGVALAVAALCLGAETGGRQAQAVDGVALTLRQRQAVAAEARALATQAKASAAVMAVAPLVFAGLASATDPRIGAFLFSTPAGLGLLAAGLALDGLGGLWMARITRGPA